MNYLIFIDSISTSSNQSTSNQIFCFNSLSMRLSLIDYIANRNGLTFRVYCPSKKSSLRNLSPIRRPCHSQYYDYCTRKIYYCESHRREIPCYRLFEGSLRLFTKLKASKSDSVLQCFETLKVQCPILIYHIL